MSDADLTGAAFVADVAYRSCVRVRPRVRPSVRRAISPHFRGQRSVTRDDIGRQPQPGSRITLDFNECYCKARLRFECIPASGDFKDDASYAYFLISRTLVTIYSNFGRAVKGSIYTVTATCFRGFSKTSIRLNISGESGTPVSCLFSKQNTISSGAEKICGQFSVMGI